MWADGTSRARRTYSTSGTGQADWTLWADGTNRARRTRHTSGASQADWTLRADGAGRARRARRASWPGWTLRAGQQCNVLRAEIDLVFQIRNFRRLDHAFLSRVHPV